MVQIFRVSFSSKSHNQSTQKENMGFLAAYLFQENPAQEEKDVLRLKKVLFVLFSGKKEIADEKVSFSSEKDILSPENNDFLGLC